MNAEHVDMQRYMETLEAAYLADLRREFREEELLSDLGRFTEILDFIAIRYQNELDEMLWKLATREDYLDVAADLRMFLLNFTEVVAKKIR